MRCIYLIYWGATEPIGIAGTVPTVELLASEHEEEVFLVSFDKPADKTPSVVAQLRDRFLPRNIRWRDLGYTKSPQNLSTAYDMARGVAYCSWLIARHRVDVLHARTFVASVMGMGLKTIFPNLKVVCHPDGFWPHERVDDGVWTKDSRAHRLGLFLERKMQEKADGIIVLSERARNVLRENPKLRDKPIVVVHTSVDEKRFALRKARAADEPLAILYLGSLGGRRMTEEVFAFLAVASKNGCRCTVATHSPLSQLEPAMKAAGLTPADVGLCTVLPEEVPALVARHHAGIFMLRPGLSNVATSATKVGEYLAAGLPVALTDTCGDLHDIVEATNTGVVIRRHDEAGYRQVIDRLKELTLDPTTPARCRDVAVRTMGVAHCADEQARLHRRVLGLDNESAVPA